MTDQTNGRLKEILDHALETNQEESIVRVLASLLRHKRDGANVHLYADFATLSMQFSVVKDGRATLHGGVIYHGAPGENIPENFTSTLTKTTGWSIHT